jgi:hypothetical protein
MGRVFPRYDRAFVSADMLATPKRMAFLWTIKAEASTGGGFDSLPEILVLTLINANLETGGARGDPFNFDILFYKKANHVLDRSLLRA